MLSTKEVAHIASLARLHIPEGELLGHAEQLSKALAYFQQISQVETAGIEPLVTPVEIAENWREDVSQRELSAEEILQNAPQKTGHLFTVPPVV